MSRRGNPYDNSRFESFFKTLKVEAVYVAEYANFADVADVAADLSRFIDEIYNEGRLHSALGYLTVHFEEINRPAPTNSQPDMSDVRGALHLAHARCTPLFPEASAQVTR